jgi:hypothetical protein
VKGSSVVRRLGAGWYGFVAIVLVVIGILFLLTELQSPDFLMWTGRSASGVEDNSIVHYQVNGVDYSLNAHDQTPTDPARTVTVYYDPANPNRATQDKPAGRWSEAAIAGLPFIAAAALYAVGLMRRREADRRRSGAAEKQVYGVGYDADVLRHLADRRRPDR